MTPPRQLLPLLAFAPALALACGRSSLDDVLGVAPPATGDDATTASDDASSSSGTTSTSGVSSSGTGSSTGGSSGGSNGSSSSTSGSSGSSASSSGSRRDAGVDAGPPPSSCAPGGAGMTSCGPGGSGTESCCTSLSVPGGTFHRTYTNTGSGPTGEADPATVSAFRLDKYEVTVGRFRQFVRAWNGGTGLEGGSGFLPAVGSGKHTHLNGGRGLAAGPNVDAGQTYEPGWVASDDSRIAPTASNFTSCSFAPTWSASPAGNENLPINCLTWQDAYAFCIWDGGFLPSEAEWEFAAAGGADEREYPWGSTAPGTGNQYAIWDYNYNSQGSGFCNGTVACIAPVGTPTLGAGRWGQLDLAGNVYEWTLDWYAAVYPLPCVDCVDVTAGGTGRVNRGGFYDDTLTADLLATSRSSGNATYRVSAFGLRCARVP